MADLTETAQWEAGIRRIETTDPVLGGEDGPINAGIKQLANRTRHIKESLDLDDHKTIEVEGEATATRETITATAAATNTGAIKGTGNGTAPGVSGTGGATGVGVVGVGGATGGSGGEFTGTAGNAGGVVCTAHGIGTGVRGNAPGGGVGVSGFIGNIGQTASIGVAAENYGGGYALLVSATVGSPVRAALRLVPQSAAPSGASQVGDIYVTTAGVLKICTVAGTGVGATWVSVGAQT